MHKNIIKYLLIAALIFAFSCFSLKTYALENYEWNIGSELSSSYENTLTIRKPSNELNLECGSAILIDQQSGQVLYDHNSHEQLRPASVTKIMSILLIMEAIDSGKISLTDKVPCSEKACSMGGSQVWLTTSEVFTVNDMLKCICVVSANDCTVAMAEYLYGSTDAFVERMNERAKELGMNDTCFKNCHGIDEDGHVSSAYDIALMSRELLINHPSITKYTTIWMDSIRDGKSELVNTNKLVRNYEGCTGLKTGSTSLALYNLSASATRNNLSLIAVIMKAPTTAKRFSEAKQLLDYGFNNYSSLNLAKKDEVVKIVSVEKGIDKSINGVFANDKFCMIPKGNDLKVTQVMNVPDSIEAPVSKNQKIGEIQYFYDNELLSTVDIVSDKDVEKNSLANMIKKWFGFFKI